MKKNIIYLCVCLGLLLSSCGDKNKDKPVTVAGRTVLVYIAADNSLSSFSALDIEEMVEGMGSVDTRNNNLLVYYDDKSKTQLIHITKDKNGRAIKDIIKEYDSRNSVGVSEMKEVFSFAFSKYQAQSYGIVFWSHGEGWIPKSVSTRWFGQDGSNFMNISELNEALAVCPHFEFIFFDACFMQSIEVVYELKAHADYFISSPTEIPGPGAPYQVVVPAMFKQSGSAVSIAQAYFNYYNERYTGRSPSSNADWTGGVSVSVITSSKLDQFAEETAQILPEYITNIRNIDVSGILCYDNRSSKYYYDLDGIIKKLTQGNEDYDRWNSSFEAMMPYYKTTAKNYSQFGGMFSMEGFRGISTSIPRSNTTPLGQYYTTFKWYSKAGWDKIDW